MFIHRTLTRLLAIAMLLVPAACCAQDDYPKAAVEAKEKYDAALVEAAKKLGQVKSKVEEKQAVELASAQTVHDLAIMTAKREYIAALKRIQQTEDNAVIAAQLKYLTSGAPRNEFQKQWAKVNEAEKAKDYATAVEVIREMVTKNEEVANAYVYLRLARVYTKQEKYELAIAAYKRAADAATESPVPLYGLITCYLAIDQPDKALAAAKDVLLLNPIDYYANKTLADQYYKAQDFKRAAVHYATLCKAYPEDVESSNGLAWSYVGLNSHALAKPIFLAVLTVNPENELATAGYFACVEAEKQSAKPDKPSP